MTQIAPLYEVLDQLLDLHKALYTLADQKKEVLIKGDVESLMNITKQEGKLLRAVEQAEASRIEMVKRIYEAKGLPLINGTLQDLIKSTTSADEKSRLQHYREELIRIVSELRQANELNQQLLEQSLSFINANLELLTDSPEEDYIYRNPSGYGSGTSANRSYINKKA
ncbi:flagellar protein FlgN [Brevibacillus humidisoli]|uniref:flagellar protein FlgN n=1 Tax=Brevibacillus humidisoli TaxID=2895522 RepID=UPI001E3ACABB|nr:flagellar protein FlgN [Brevibacillus humidisoli]UFJ43374.1 flagellar protein FlgN [Brevibacillus humidisoli]